MLLVVPCWLYAEVISSQLKAAVECSLSASPLSPGVTASMKEIAGRRQVTNDRTGGGEEEAELDEQATETELRQQQLYSEVSESVVISFWIVHFGSRSIRFG